MQDPIEEVARNNLDSIFEAGCVEKPLTELLPDTGARSNFQTGAIRDASEGKGIPSEIPPCAIRAIAKRFEQGAIKYERGNWRKGLPLSRYQDAIMRHCLQAAEGEVDEDHIAAVAINACMWMETDRLIKLGKLPSDLNDLPYHKDNQ